MPIRSAPQRRLLAMLLARDGEPVRLSELIDGLWPAAPSKNAEGNVRSYVSRLNDVLPGPDRVKRGPAGYAITLRQGESDAREFAHLVEQAGTARRAGNAEHAAESLHRALALWRGSPYAGLEDCPLLVPVIEGLRQLRFKALEEHAEISLELGRHTDLVPELTARLAEHPDRERLAGLLMRAQYGSGQQTAALETYRRIWNFLDEEHGVEPSAELRALHEAVLRRDPGLEPARSKPSGRMQLPTGVYGFAGRNDELARLDGLLDAAVRQSTAVVISAVSGTAGVGKTALAVHWAHRVADRFPDGQLYVNLRGFDPSGRVMDPVDAVRGFLDALGVTPERIPVDLDARAALYRSLLDGKRMLVVLDNARDSEQVRPLLPGSPTCLAIVTSRNQLTGLLVNEGAQPLSLDLLSSTDARELLARRLGQDRVAAEPQAVQEIIELCARLPLALAIVAARAATYSGFPLHTLAAELRDTRGRLDAFTDARAVFSWSYQQLSAEAQRLFRLLGLHPGPDISAPAAASLCGVPMTLARKLMAELTHAHLVTEHAPGRYTFHDLLRTYAAELAHQDTDRLAAIHRLLDHYLHTARTADELLNPHLDRVKLAQAEDGVTPEPLAGYDEAMRWLTAERLVLLAVLGYSAGKGFHTHVWQLTWTLDTFLDRQGHWHERAAAWQAALEATRLLADRPGEASAYRNLADVNISLRRGERAYEYLQLALDFYTELADPIGMANTHILFGRMLESEGRNAEALSHAQQTLDLFRAAGHRRGQAIALNNIGWYHAELGSPEQTLVDCRQALGLHQELGNRAGEAATWDTLGYAHHKLGRHRDALGCYQRAVGLYRSLVYREGEADTLIHVGDTHHATGDTAAARQAWQQALTILDDLDHPEADQVRAKLDSLG